MKDQAVPGQLHIDTYLQPTGTVVCVLCLMRVLSEGMYLFVSCGSTETGERIIFIHYIQFSFVQKAKDDSNNNNLSN